MRTRSSQRFPTWAIYILLGLFVVLVVGLSLLTFFGVRGMVASAPIRDTAGFDGEVESEQPLLSNDPQATLDPNWVEGRVTLLLMGIDERELEEGPPRTDTMIVVTVDPVNERMGMISIPRDLWVNIPNYTDVYDKVNTAYFRGEADNFPGGGGPTLARLTVQQSIIGRPVPYYVTINFDAFVQAVNEIGCVPINVPQTIVDETYPDSNFGYDPFTIEAGEQCLDGDMLLKYARTRATYGGDFDRAARQQQVIYAVRDHVLNTSQLPSLISRSPQVYDSVADGIQTNLTLSEMVALGRVAAEIPEENICSAVIDNEFVQLATLDDGTEILIPDRERINQLVADVYNGTGRCSPEAGQMAGAAFEEAAVVQVLNGTQREGLATEVASQLTASGLTVTGIGNATTRNQAQTRIQVYSGKMASARYIATLLDLPESAIEEVDDRASDFDIEIILGGDLSN